MKTINMIPYDVVRNKNIKKIKKGGTYFVALSVGTAFGLSHYLHLIETDIIDLQKQLNDSESVKQQIKTTNEEIQKLIEVQEVTSNNNFPYHRFFYKVSSTLPEDMRIVSINTKDISDSKSEDQGEMTPNSDLESTTAPEELSIPETTDSASAESTLPSPVPTPPNENTTVPGETEQPAPLPEQPNNAKTFEFEESTIFIKGYNLYPDSIATFAEDLRTESYISSVKVTRIDNYNLGFSNLKFFEIEIKSR